MPPMEKEDLAALLKKVEFKITFSQHFLEKARIRGIKPEEVLGEVKSLQKLLSIEDQGDEQRGHKYGLLFRTKLSNYDLKVAVSVRSKSLNIVTAHLQNIRKRKAYGKWLKG